MSDRARPVPLRAVIVAHGSPSNPDPQDRAMRALAASVARHLPGADVVGVTLASEGRFEAALDSAAEGQGAPLVYPFFMARGWFTETFLRRRTGNRPGWQMAPFGLEPGLPDLAAGTLRKTLAEQAWAAGDTTLFLAAHGSRSNRASRDSALRAAPAIAKMAGMARVRVGFVEEAPFLAETARDLGQAICLPFFALPAGHVTEDIPEALAEARFDGPVLPPFVDHHDVGALIAASLARAARARRAA
ncbi:cobalamin biosynthesis protein CbiX [Aquicoccus porphyridii]|uniref:Cobalamin biosynthesis protein CbiX n=1 Tax=Aquicoccus porphyridii TaxID=1852029 RepID=A0A5A9YZG8_9RHOB|nr:CbiX/SirB N-terminal domain-containing protein [Aquicoccus porphyridii]KAA0910245.1 cobalamin biosynthesis protein CbiX [Aquicoccus porphyridii]RAI54393.1 cobalamin biosynthesis protein CbiX [Rhodobacteraceae bacterium AsT-22]